MGIWTTFTGKITTHQSDNFSAKKALKEYYDGHDFTVSLFLTRQEGLILLHNLLFSRLTMK